MLPKQVAIDIYRIAQECLTNAIKHGTPTNTNLKIEYPTQEKRAVSLVVEDDGGGDAKHVNKEDGHGIVGIRERVTGLGGRLSIANAASGIRIVAVIPIMGPHDVFPLGVAA